MEEYKEENSAEEEVREEVTENMVDINDKYKEMIEMTK